MGNSRNPRSGSGAAALVSIGAIALVGLGCVSASAHKEVVDERDRLENDKARLIQRAEMLSASAKSLEDQRADVLDQLEDLRLERERLSKDVARLAESEAALGSRLQESEEALNERNAEVERLRGTYEGLVQDLESEVAEGQIQIQQLREGLQVNVSDEILFPSGSALLNQAGADILVKVAARLKELPHRVEVRGHSDNLQISGALKKRYPSNWELAGARAASVVRLLQGQGLGGERLSAVSHAEFEPVADNATPEGRSLNRRIEIRLHPIDDAVSEAEASEGADAATPAADEAAAAAT